jgi:hypothetical protein
MCDIRLHLLGKAIHNHAAYVNPTDCILCQCSWQKLFKFGAIGILPQYLLQSLDVNAEPYILKPLVLGILKVIYEALSLEARDV